jgi:hypothetical protein
VLSNVLGSTVASQKENENLGYLLWGGFCEIFPIFRKVNQYMESVGSALI